MFLSFNCRIPYSLHAKTFAFPLYILIYLIILSCVFSSFIVNIAWSFL
nr:MAG TPA: hypothetical protein [Caudoviricetes sp.]